MSESPLLGKRRGIQKGRPLWQFAAFAVLAPETILAGCLCGSVTQCHEISECQRTACDIHRQLDCQHFITTLGGEPEVDFHCALVVWCLLCVCTWWWDCIKHPSQVTCSIPTVDGWCVDVFLGVCRLPSDSMKLCLLLSRRRHFSYPTQ